MSNTVKAIETPTPLETSARLENYGVVTPAAPQPEKHDLVSKIENQKYSAGTVDRPQVSKLAVGDMILVGTMGVTDFSRVTHLTESVIPAHVEWQGVRSNRPRPVREVSVVGAERPLVFRLDSRVTRAK